MRGNIKKTKIPVEVEFTDGYQERFTVAVLKIYASRIDRQEGQNGKQSREIYNCIPQCRQVRVS